MALRIGRPLLSMRLFLTSNPLPEHADDHLRARRGGLALLLELAASQGRAVRLATLHPSGSRPGVGALSLQRCFQARSASGQPFPIRRVAGKRNLRHRDLDALNVSRPRASHRVLRTAGAGQQARHPSRGHEAVSGHFTLLEAVSLDRKLPYF